MTPEGGTATARAALLASTVHHLIAARPRGVRMLLLVALAVLALPLYDRLLHIGSAYDSRPGEMLWLLLGTTAIYGIACWCILTASGPSSATAWVEVALLAALGLAFRAVFYAAPPGFSHDAYRYVWDAHLVAHGVSPYTHIVVDPALTSLRDTAIWPRINWRDSPTIYPPGAELFYLLVYRIAPLSLPAMKAALALCDGLVGVMTIILLHRRRLDLRRFLIYWWCPIPILEFAFNAHVDALALVWTLAAVLLADRQRRGARVVAGACLSFAVLTKLYPLLFVVVLVHLTYPKQRHFLTWARSMLRADRGFVLALVGTMALAYLPFVRLGLGGGGFLGTYFRQRFVDQGLLLKWLSFAVIGLGGNAAVLLIFQAALIAGATLTIGALWWRARGAWRVEAGILALSAIWIVLSPHLLPWYSAALLPWLALLLPGGQPHSVARTGQPALASVWRAKLNPAGAMWLGLWLFVGVLPFTYVIFARGGNAELFQVFFYAPCLVGLAPLLMRWHPALGSAASRQRVAALLAGVRASRTPPT